MTGAGFLRRGVAVLLLAIAACLTTLGVSVRADDAPLQLALVASPPPASSMAIPASACKVGRPAYCAKYKGVCDRASGRHDCAAWVSACGQCHEIAAECTAGATAGSSTCRQCETQWSRCMDRGYARHWPLPH